MGFEFGFGGGYEFTEIPHKRNIEAGRYGYEGLGRESAILQDEATKLPLQKYRDASKIVDKRTIHPNRDVQQFIEETLVPSQTKSAAESADVFISNAKAKEKVAQVIKEGTIQPKKGVKEFIDSTLVPTKGKSAEKSAAVFIADAKAKTAKLMEEFSTKIKQPKKGVKEFIDSTLVPGTAKSAEESAKVFIAESQSKVKPMKIMEEFAKKIKKPEKGIKEFIDSTLVPGTAKSAEESAKVFEQAFAKDSAKLPGFVTKAVDFLKNNKKTVLIGVAIATVVALLIHHKRKNDKNI